jgi:hypothetical protein
MKTFALPSQADISDRERRTQIAARSARRTLECELAGLKMLTEALAGDLGDAFAKGRRPRRHLPSRSVLPAPGGRDQRTAAP